MPSYTVKTGTLPKSTSPYIRNHEYQLSEKRWIMIIRRLDEGVYKYYEASAWSGLPGSIKPEDE